MNLFWRVALVFSFVFSFDSTVAQQSVHFKKVGKRQGEYIVKLKERPSIFSFGQKGFLGKSRLSLKKALSSMQKIYLVKQSSSAGNDEQIIKELASHGDVAYVEPNYIYHASFGSRKPKPGPPPPFLPIPVEPEPAPAPAPTPPSEPTPLPPAEDPNAVLPNDPQLGNQWSMHNPSGASAYASHAWNISTGSRDVVVAVVDSGVDYNHKDLKGNIWSGVVGGQNVKGYNAITRAYDPMDDNSHGTHVAGVIGASTDNRIGIAGINWDVRIMPIKFLDRDGSGSTADAIAGIDWAVEHGANVMNMSWGGGGYSQALYESLQRAEAEGVVLVAAAGNESANNDSVGSYPANYDVESMMSVAASDSRDRMASFSNYGRTSVDLMAPGVGILSTVPGHSYASYNGTSMASPHVAGAAALLLARYPSMTPAEVKDTIMKTVDKVSSAANFIISGGRLNIDKMIRY
ncbi:S8 family serine peptidase [bacterium]|nr:S8 family serine peptidase [bacterium]